MTVANLMSVDRREGSRFLVRLERCYRFFWSRRRDVSERRVARLWLDSGANELAVVTDVFPAQRVLW